MSTRCFPVCLCLFALIAGHASPARAREPREAAAAIARAAGYDDFGSIRAITFTFNVKAGEKQIVRMWKWWPKEDKVRYIAPTGELTRYTRGSADMPEEIDGWFINDQYWLLFPLHLMWDKNVRLENFEPTAENTADAGEPVKGLRVIYEGQDGYSPGDIYELLYNDEHRIVWWIYRKGGSGTPTLETAWKDYRRFGPLTLSLERPGKKEGFRLFFTDLEVLQ